MPTSSTSECLQAHDTNVLDELYFAPSYNVAPTPPRNLRRSGGTNIERLCPGGPTLLTKVTMKMRVYSYVVTHDTGFAPNPFFGYCTLACCKPGIRRRAAKGDWIVGLSPKASGNRMIYYMRVDEVIDSFADYWLDRRFRAKRARSSGGVRDKCGDNIYEPISPGEYRQRWSAHNGWREDWENPDTKEHDLGGIRVLVSETFAYFGSKAQALPPVLKCMYVGRGHKCSFSDEEVDSFVRLAGKTGFGVFGPPTNWPEHDPTWSMDPGDNGATSGRGQPSTSRSRTECR